MTCIKPATGANTALYYIEELVCGITPDTPAWTPMRFTGGIPVFNRDVLESGELTGQREKTNQRSGNQNVLGDINCELSYGSFDELIAACLQSDWVADDPEAGQDTLKVASTVKTFSLLVKYGDLEDGTPHYDIITGVEFTGFSLTCGVNAYDTITFSTIGRGYAADATLTAGSTFLAATTSRPFTGIDVSAINAGGAALGFVTSVSPTNENAAEPSFALGSTGVSYVSYGRANNTFTIETAFSDYVMFSKFINEVEFDFNFTLVLDNQSLKFTFPRCSATSGGPSIEGEGTISESIEVQALYDVTENSSLVIVRDPAIV